MEVAQETLFTKTATELSQLLAEGKLTSVEITQAFINRTKEVDGKVKAFLRYNEVDALAQAKASDERRAAGKALSPLDGVPVAIKDNMAQHGERLTCASKILEDFLSPYDGTVVKKLKEAGAVLWGRLNMDEFAMGSTTEHSAFQETTNPWALDCNPGGSSGGSAAAVAACEAPLTLGSDTGGSIRQPAAFCGIVGLKPTYGLVSRYGLVAFASSLDQIGPMARTVEDAAMLLQVIAGHDEKDSTSYDKADIPNYVDQMKAKQGPWTLGVPKEYFGEGLDPEVKAAVESAIKFYESEGCKIQQISLPLTKFAVPLYYIIAPAEASSNLGRYDGIRYSRRSEHATNAIDIYYKSRSEGFGEEVKRRIMLGSYVLSSGYYDAYYVRAQKIRTLVRQDFMKAFESVDAILCPTTPTPAFKLGEKADDPMAMYLNDIFTISANLAGLPGISIPCGFTQGNKPIGLQLMGKPFQEADLLAIAHKFESGHDFHNKIAQL